MLSVTTGVNSGVRWSTGEEYLTKLRFGQVRLPGEGDREAMPQNNEQAVKRYWECFLGWVRSLEARKNIVHREAVCIEGRGWRIEVRKGLEGQVRTSQT